MIVTIISLIYINYKLRPLILDIAETKITQYINKAMSIVVHHTIYQDLSSDELLEFQYDQTGRVVSYNINLQLENQLKSHMYERVDLYLKYLEQGIILNQSDILMTDQRRKQIFSDLDQRKDETVFTIPLGQALDLLLF
jgi:hypothetical protein